MTARRTAALGWGISVTHSAEGFGLGWQSDIAMPAFHDGNPASWAARGVPTIHVERIDTVVPRAITLSLPTRRLRQICTDGARVQWGEQALFDLIGGDHITYCPGPDWTGALPTGFYATLAALTCAWRGDMPLHASAVAWQGRAILVAGPAGAGKSTSLAAMLAAGAQLVGDDLTVLAGGDGPAIVRRGRPDVRLHPDTLPLVAWGTPPRPAADDSGKWIGRPTNGWRGDALPLGALLLLSDDDRRLPAFDAARSVHELLFRPRLQAGIPGFRDAMTRLMEVAGQYPVYTAAKPRDFSATGLIAHGRRLLALATSWADETAQSAFDRHPTAPPQ